MKEITTQITTQIDTNEDKVATQIITQMNTHSEKEMNKENDLSKKLIGIAFEIYNLLGYGLSEKIYQKAFEIRLKELKIAFQREKYSRINLNGVFVGKYFLDFLIDNILAVELKVKNEIYEEHVNQLLNYIKSENIKLGLLLVMSKRGVLIKRVIN